MTLLSLSRVSITTSETPETGASSFSISYICFFNIPPAFFFFVSFLLSSFSNPFHSSSNLTPSFFSDSSSLFSSLLWSSLSLSCSSSLPWKSSSSSSSSESSSTLSKNGFNSIASFISANFFCTCNFLSSLILARSSSLSFLACSSRYSCAFFFLSNLRL